MDFTRFMFHQKKSWFKDFDQLKYIVPTADWMNEKLKLTFLKNTPKYKIINGIDTAIFRPINQSQISILNDYRDKIIILSVIGKLDDSNKGYERLCRIAETTVNDKILFVVIGKSKKRLQDKSNLLHVPKVNNPSVLNEYYNVSDYFMILSEYETYPTVCLEASATNTPIIGYNVGGVLEASRNVPTYLYPFGSTELVYFINDIESKVTKEISEDYKQLDNQFMIQEYLNLYQEVMN
jgi:glycosyltransferase involved in cell wall biosynthesis